MEDSEIIALFLERDEKAIAASSEKFGKYCKAIARRILKNEEDVNDCVNEVYLKAWETIPPEKTARAGFIFREAYEKSRAQSA